MTDDKEYFEERTCGRKRRFKDEATAKAVRQGMHERVRIYGPCIFCGGYHIGRPNQDKYWENLSDEPKPRRGKPGRTKTDTRKRKHKPKRR